MKLNARWRGVADGHGSGRPPTDGAVSVVVQSEGADFAGVRGEAKGEAVAAGCFRAWGAPQPTTRGREIGRWTIRGHYCRAVTAGAGGRLVVLARERKRPIPSPP